VDAARRRLREEMGIDCELEEVFCFLYSVKFAHDLFEHEYDHVIIGKYNGAPDTNPEEASEWKWSQMDRLMQDMHTHPDNYTYWLRKSIERVISHVAIKL
jgi:isopentenyl-diphosphate delta-isomerase